jgi:hypothetical protein
MMLIVIPVLFGAVFVATYLLGLLVNLVNWMGNLFLFQTQAPFISLRTIAIISTAAASLLCGRYIWAIFTQPLIN